MTMRPFLLTLVLATTAAAHAQDVALPPVEDFVRMRNYHGMDYTVASRYGPEAVDPLRRILGDDGARPYWDQTVWLLGIIATPDAVETLIRFHEERFKGAVGPEALQALLLVPQALGFAAHDPESRAFEYLRQGTDPGAIARRDLEWTVEGWESGSREVLLAKVHVNGLGLAGNEPGRRHLQTLRRTLPDQRPELWRVLAPNVEEAIELSLRIEEVGYLRALAPSGRPTPAPEQPPNQPSPSRPSPPQRQ